MIEQLVVDVILQLVVLVIPQLEAVVPAALAIAEIQV